MVLLKRAKFFLMIVLIHWVLFLIVLVWLSAKFTPFELVWLDGKVLIFQSPLANKLNICIFFNT